MMPMWALMVVSWNAASGPMQDMLRWRQLGQAWDTMFSEYSLYKPAIREVRRQDIEGPRRLRQLVRRRQPRRAALAAVEERAAGEACRSHEIEQVLQIPLWYQSLMATEFVALEEGMITGPRIPKLVVWQESRMQAAGQRRALQCLPTGTRF